MNLFEEYEKKSEEQRSAEEQKARAEALQLKEDTAALIKKIEYKLNTKDFKCMDLGKPTISLDVTFADRRFGSLPDMDIENEVVETLENDGFGPIECIELSSFNHVGLEQFGITVLLYIIPNKA